MPEEIGPLQDLTSPLLRLADGRLALSVETNKTYEDRSKWLQRVVFFHSTDGGPHVERTGHGRLRSNRPYFTNWDQRAAVALDGRIAAFVWTYDNDSCRYLDIHRRVSRDGGFTWSPAKPLGFSDQPSRPAILPDGRVVLAWVDRFGSRSIRARLATDVEAPFDPPVRS